MQNLAPKKLRAHTTVDCPACCWLSLGLGNTARAEILEGDVWRALKSVCSVVGGMIFPPIVGPRWRLEVSKKRRRGPRAEYNTRRGRGHETVDEEIFTDALRRPEIEAMRAWAKNLR